MIAKTSVIGGFSIGHNDNANNNNSNNHQSLFFFCFSPAIARFLNLNAQTKEIQNILQGF